ncbi:hypothetical protein [Mycolicibacterium fortuitum]|uniref:hypothetical protein n=1 Tax=Mycolicibacterium fortuitum TaxID=1766 RepID=UPI00096CA2F5|nr:hypothetical protein [Mycolicibacterium fortuitum]OMC02168.1 hypothetical protein A5734_14990 [Mycolicibacterium fortuitum]
MAVFRAKEGFSYDDKDGVPRIVVPGTLMSDSDPGFKGRESLFEPVEAHVVAESARRRGKQVEDTSAEPNSRRSISTNPQKGDDK